MLVHLFQIFTHVLLLLLAGDCCAHWLKFALPYSIYRISRKSDTKQNVQLCILFHNNKQTKHEMAIGDCVLAKISKNNDQSVDDNDINVND